MTYKELKTYVLQLLDRYSVNGEEVALSYNCQADDVERIPALARDGLYYVATAGKKLRALVRLPEGGAVGDLAAYDLPEDYYQMAGGLYRTDPQGHTAPYHRFRMIGGRQLLVPREDRGVFMLEYYRYPNVPDFWPEDEDDTLDCPEEAGSAVAYYVAAHLAMEDDSGLYAALYNEFERKMSRLSSVTGCCNAVDDVYEL